VMLRTRDRTFVCLAILLAFGLRVHWLGRQELRGDEGGSWSFIQLAPLQILDRIVTEGDPHPPLHHLLQWGWLQLTGDSEFAMRSLSALLSILVVPLLLQLGRRLGGVECGLAVCLIVSVHPQQVWLAQDLRNMYQLALIFILAGALMMLYIRDRPLAIGWHHWVAYSGLCTLAVYSHYYALFGIAPHAALLVQARPQRARLLRMWLLAAAATALVLAPWATVILPVYAQHQLADPGNEGLKGYLVTVFGELFAGPTLPWVIQLGFAVLGGALAVLGAVRLKAARFYLLVAVLVPLTGIYTVLLFRATLNGFYFVFAAPAAYILLAAGIRQLQHYWHAMGWTAAFGGIVVLTVGLINLYGSEQYSRSRGMRELAQFLTSNYQPGDTYLANFPDPTQPYYLRRVKIPYQMMPKQPVFDSSALNADLASLENQRIWFVPVVATNWDAAGYVQQRLLQTALLASDQSFNKMRLMLFLPVSDAQSIRAKFANGIALVGFHRAPNGVTLVWRSEASPTADYKVFVHGLALDGFPLVGADALPVRATSTWRTGDTVLSLHQLVIPVDQPVALVAGLYDAVTGMRVELQSENYGEPDATLVARYSP